MIKGFMSPSIIIEISLTVLFLEKRQQPQWNRHTGQLVHVIWERLRQSLVEQLILIQKMKNL